MSPAYYSLLRCLSGSPSLSSYFFPSPSPSPAQPQSSPSRHLPCSALRVKSPKQNISRCRSSSPAPVSLSREAAGQSAIQRISEKLRSLGYVEDNVGSGPGDPPPTGPGSPGEIFIPTPYEIPKHRVGYTIDPSWGTPEHPVPEPGSGATIARFRELWKREKERESSQPARNDAKVPTVAELTLTRKELKRLRTLGIALKKRLKVGKAGITEGIVNGIHERWRRSEVVKIKCEDICLLNMKRTHQILERKTGGLVVWRSGSIVVLYRGTDYKYPYFHAGEEKNLSTYEESVESNVHHVAETDRRSGSLFTHGANTSSKSTASIVTPKYVAGVGSPNKLRFQLPGEAQLDEEAERLLDGLGPRFTDWWGYSPHPVDADLLPPIVLSYRKPFRLLPFGLKPKLTNREATILKRLSRHIPFHFALGRNKNLQGLAVSMLKLWEKCEVAKIAVKRGVQNTNSEMMAEELKKLTGGTLLSRDKDFIIFYRGKDFLPPVVSIAIEERRKLNCGDKKQMEEQISPSISIFSPKVLSTSPASDGEVHVAGNKERSLLAVRNAKSSCSALRKVEAKLNWTKQKIEKTEKHLAEYEKLVEPSEVESDKEGISKEERYMLRRVGLRMKPFLLLGRRDVFDGTVENMHLHWKYRELVKIICNNRCIENVERDARTLESESGGILVAVERVSKGYAIIIFRGKNYRRPADLRPKTLLNKKEALKRALEAQRYKSLKLYALRLSKDIDGFNHQVKNDCDGDTLSCMELNSPNKINDQNGPIKTGESNVLVPKMNCDLSNLALTENVESNEGRAESFVSDGSHVVSGQNQETVNLIDRKQEYEFAEKDVAEQSLAPTRSTLMLHNEEGPVGDELQEGSKCSNGFSLETVSTDLSYGTGWSLPASPSVKIKAEPESDVKLVCNPAPLSNQERLLLRKQALRMRKRPVLAVGRSNILTGVATTIKTHFKKHPLAIVNIKGRAKGTSPQELVFELEQATGSVLVSREPNKIILYRGWGEEDSPGDMKRNDASRASKEVNKSQVSPELMEAVRRECRLPIAEA